MKKSILLSFFTLKALFLWGQQKTIKFHNPSFEHEPFITEKWDRKTVEIAKIVDDSLLDKMGWSGCGFENTSPPDVQPGKFGVKAKAAHGQSYISMVTRDDKTWEGLSQKLPETLKKDSCYQFSINLMRAPKLVSATAKNRDKEQIFYAACRLRVWGGRKLCQPKELLIETAPIREDKWLKYRLQFSPYSDFDYMYFEAYYATDFPENGNVMLDNLSDITLIPCE